MGGSNLRKPPLINFGLIQFTAIQGIKLPGSPYFVTTKGGQEQFPGKRAIVLLRSDDAALAARFYVGSIRGRRLSSLESPQRSTTTG